MPRSYRLGQRAEAKSETRRRILDAALTIYRDQGMAAASTLAVARAADVAPGTVRNHFPEAGDLAGAVLESVLGELQPPRPAIFDGVPDVGRRVRRLAESLAEFYERSEPWWRAYQREPELIGAWNSGADRFYADLDALMRAALGPLATDAEAVAVVASVIGPPTFFAMRGRGMSAGQAVELGVALTVPWLEARASGREVGGQPVQHDGRQHAEVDDQSADRARQGKRRREQRQTRE
jgi:AcrR family transcriptional regulator